MIELAQPLAGGRRLVLCVSVGAHDRMYACAWARSDRTASHFRSTAGSGFGAVDVTRDCGGVLVVNRCACVRSKCALWCPAQSWQSGLACSL